MLISYVSYIHYAPTNIKQNYGHQQIRALQTTHIWRISTEHSSFNPPFLIITIPQFGIITNIPKYHTDYLYRGGLFLKYICFYEFVQLPDDDCVSQPNHVAVDIQNAWHS